MEEKNSSKKANLLLAKILFIIGASILLLSIFSSYKLSSSKTSEVFQRINDPGAPVSIEIPTIKTYAKITKGGVVNGEWILSDSYALYLPTSGKINEGFNTIIYAHNTDKLFGKLKDIKIGDKIIVKNEKGETFNYSVFLREDINAKDLKKLYSDNKNVLTLFTCDGWADTSRLLVRANLDTAPNSILLLIPEDYYIQKEFKGNFKLF